MDIIGRSYLIITESYRGNSDVQSIFVLNKINR